MIRLFVVENERLRIVDDFEANKDRIVWVDLFSPTKEEDAVIEDWIGVSIPSLEEMEEIEISSRLYVENGAQIMTATLPAHADGDRPKMSPVTFVLAGTRLITVRYHEPRAFQTFPQRAEKVDTGCHSGDTILIGLLEAIVDRLADVLERASTEVVAISHDIFHPSEKKASKRDRDFQLVLRRIGRKEDLVSKIQDSLLTLQRLSGFLANAAIQHKNPKDMRARIKTLSRDILSLSDHASFQTQKINFLLDATLGMINIEQNAIIKIVSVAAVVFLPPTLVASIYGMNFELMPELRWILGYPLALTLMVVSAVLPFWFFRRKGWL
ncbi:MAG: magnesium transporter CorA family protein [Alphaproteobacteria bacterium]|jgi:magnesium transporter|nr:magnesium transporter CorA family protein [Alphaproteobacteria bacterium]MBU0803004.1 magnesium transporter CorA family protein [Alphaproteobacteria bacterium]MBU0870885.1 magnesium transporter CorA family protein [Alphaproteobacteria bacterium]MBU1403444.1 magnesium transporter CorA family protein [Alphaproteobacteria bacterium]MBU1589780.1 magnesium transporter CorA family protein [Alphaproteobacteria bacterium]